MSEHVNRQQISYYEQMAEDLIHKAKEQGASQVEFSLSVQKGLDVHVRKFDVETLEYVNSQGLGLTVYYGKRKGYANTSDMTKEAAFQTLEKACHIAKYTQEDDCSGLAELSLMAYDYPSLELYYPWGVDAETAIQMAIECEREAMATDKRLTNSEGVNVSTHESFLLYANSHSFLGRYFTSSSSMNCCLIAGKEHMQRSYEYTVAVDAKDLWDPSRLAQQAAKKTLARLGARSIPSCQVPVLFSKEVAPGLLKQAMVALSGGHQYRRSSFLLESVGQSVFPSFVTIYEDPFVPKGLASTPFDAEGVRVKARCVVDKGVIQGYFLNSYSARKLGLPDTGHAGGMHNLFVSHSDKTFEELLKIMDRGLLVTELMGQGVNLVTGDYSRGASGFWVEHGEIQYPVEEITIAGNLKDMYQQILYIGSDVETRSSLQTGSILIERMSVAGHVKN